MDVGVLKETKVEEYRVGLTPTGVRALLEAEHRVFVERGAGEGSGFSDDAYAAAGATLLDSPEEIAEACDLLVKVKEPLPSEYSLLRPGLILFTFLHLAPEPELTHALLSSRVTSIAYETVELPDGSHPLLAPMSFIAGRIAAEIAIQCLKRPGPGRGKLVGGIPDVEPAHSVILGSGNVATYASCTLAALEARVTVLGRHPGELAQLSDQCGGRVATRVISAEILQEELEGVDVLISGLLVPGGVTPKLVSRQMVRSMGAGAVIVDVSIDQGGVCETSRPTSHADPIYTEEEVIHYCVANMPGAVPHTSTQALTRRTLPYILELANNGLPALRANPALAGGVNTIDGRLVLEPVARAQGLEYTPLEQVLR